MSSAMRMLLSGLLSLCCYAGWMGLATAAGIESPESIVASTTNNVLQILRREKSTFKEQPAALYAIVEKYVLPRIDFERMSRLVLGKYWRKATQGQRRRFIVEFRTLLIRTYANALLRFTAAEVMVLPSRGAVRKGRHRVRSEVRLPDAKPLAIDYRMYLKGNAWKIYDVKIDGVSMVVNYRASFKSEISHSGSVEKLIIKLEGKNQAVSNG